jgi:hypothetical protein
MGLCKYTFTQRRNHLTTHFSESTSSLTTHIFTYFTRYTVSSVLTFLKWNVLTQNRTVRSGDRIPSGDEIFRTPPDRLCGPPNLLYNGRRFSFLGVERPGCGIDYPPLPSAKVKQKIQLYYSALSGPSCPVPGWNFLTLQTFFHIFVPEASQNFVRVRHEY